MQKVLFSNRALQITETTSLGIFKTLGKLWQTFHPMKTYIMRPDVYMSQLGGIAVTDTVYV